MMKKVLLLILCGVMLSSCSMAELRASLVFDEVWEEEVSEFHFGKRSSFDQDEMLDSFGNWADIYEEKRAKYVRENEEEGLTGISVLVGENISQNIAEFVVSIEKLHEVENLHDAQKKLLRQVCAVQKTRVSCDF